MSYHITTCMTTFVWAEKVSGRVIVFWQLTQNQPQDGKHTKNEPPTHLNARAVPMTTIVMGTCVVLPLVTCLSEDSRSTDRLRYITTLSGATEINNAWNLQREAFQGANEDSRPPKRNIWKINLVLRTWLSWQHLTWCCSWSITNTTIAQWKSQFVYFPSTGIGTSILKQH